jgi:hypothetical protein
VCNARGGFLGVYSGLFLCCNACIRGRILGVNVRCFFIVVMHAVGGEFWVCNARCFFIVVMHAFRGEFWGV